MFASFDLLVNKQPNGADKSWVSITGCGHDLVKGQRLGYLAPE